MKKIMAIVLTAALFGACNCSHQQESATSGQAGVPAKLEKGKIQHTVQFSLKQDLDASETDQFLQNAERILTALPGVKNFEIYRQINTKNPYAFYFSMVFDDQQAYDTYNDHPEHVKFVKERWQVGVENFLEADFAVIE